MLIVSPVAATNPVIPGFTGNRPSFAFLEVEVDVDLAEPRKSKMNN